MPRRMRTSACLARRIKGSGVEQSATEASDRARVVADLVDGERKLATALTRLRFRLDAQLVSARAADVPHKEIAHAILQRIGGPQSADELERITRALRQRTTIAHRRHASAAGMTIVGGVATDGHAGPRNHNEDTTMERGYLRKRRIVEETYYGPAGEVPAEDLGDVEDVNHLGDDEFDDDDDLDDHDLDGVDGPGNEPR